MIDMHNHILFGVDDGAETIQDSVELIEYEIKKGVNSIVFTPHFNKVGFEIDMDIVMQNFSILEELVLNENLNVKLYLGNEIYFKSNFYEILEKKEFKTLAGSNYILIEFCLMESLENIAAMCYEARIKGFIPIIAHVERYKSLYEDRILLDNVLKERALLQVNATSILEIGDKECRKFAKYLLKRKLVSFVASDVHNMHKRSFYLDRAYKVVKKKYGDAFADKIFNLNQQKVISNEYIDAPLLKFKKFSFLSRIFKRHR